MNILLLLILVMVDTAASALLYYWYPYWPLALSAYVALVAMSLIFSVEPKPRNRRR